MMLVTDHILLVCERSGRPAIAYGHGHEPECEDGPVL